MKYLFPDARQPQAQRYGFVAAGFGEGLGCFAAALVAAGAIRRVTGLIPLGGDP